MDDFPEVPVTRRIVPLEVRFHGDGILVADGNSVWGGVVEPEIGSEIGVSVWREVPDEDGLLNPVLGEPTIEGSFQISIEGTAAGYRELARYLLAVAELDVAADPGFHEHHKVVSADGRTRFHLIVRRASDPQLT
jgi:hypothetical protein